MSPPSTAGLETAVREVVDESDALLSALHRVGEDRFHASSSALAVLGRHYSGSYTSPTEAAVIDPARWALGDAVTAGERALVNALVALRGVRRGFELAATSATPPA